MKDLWPSKVANFANFNFVRFLGQNPEFQKTIKK